MLKNLITNAGAIKLCDDDLVRLFIAWIDQYHETHFLVIKEIYKRPGITRARIWDNIKAESVFLNIPYDDAFENPLLAYIAGISAFGFVPRATLEIPFGERRLQRILKLIESSIHDLSRVQLDRNAPRTPRFNMPFDLGLTLEWAMPSTRGSFARQ
jgi:hypothetical protein